MRRLPRGKEFQRLWAPWRLTYISRIDKRSGKGCLFCRVGRRRSDTERQVIRRGRLGFTMLNRYPYINGHLLLAPYRHVGRLSHLTQEEWDELFHLIRDAMDRLDEVMNPHGYNLGVNIGRSAGAGIPDHFHFHLVPRWVGDTNFMPVLGGTRIISQSLASAHRLLKRAKGERDAS